MMIHAENWRALLPPRSDDSNKGTYGKVLLIAGSRNMCGAAYLAGKAAYRTGAGLVYIMTPECNRVILQQTLPEAVLATYDSECPDRDFVREALADKDAVVIGPGLGLGKSGLTLMEEVLQARDVPRVFDADALNLLAKYPYLTDMLQGTAVFTPHPGEMSRLTGYSIADIKAHLADTAREYAAAHHVVTLLKDHRTVVSDGTDIYRNTTGNHGMATGGSGDVLAGVIGALLAQGQDAFLAAALGCYIHGMAGDLARKARGAYSMMAGDIAEYILYGVS